MLPEGGVGLTNLKFKLLKRIPLWDIAKFTSIGVPIVQVHAIEKSLILLLYIYPSVVPSYEIQTPSILSYSIIEKRFSPVIVIPIYHKNDHI